MTPDDVTDPTVPPAPEARPQAPGAAFAAAASTPAPAAPMQAPAQAPTTVPAATPVPPVTGAPAEGAAFAAVAATWPEAVPAPARVHATGESSVSLGDAPAASPPAEGAPDLRTPKERRKAQERALRAEAAIAQMERKQAKLDARIAARAARREARLRRGTGVGVVAAAAFVSCLAGAAGGYAAALNAQQAIAPAAPAEDIQVAVTAPAAPAAAGGPGAAWVESVAKTVQPSIVSIVVEDAAQASTGSGVALTADGYIVTNAHVVAAGATAPITVRLSDGTAVRADLVGADTTYDLAVIKVPTRLTAATFDPSGVVVGEPVAAFGAPLGLTGTVTSGIVSAVARPVTAGDGTGETSIISAIQTDAAINPGNSGGALVDVDAQVVGLNSAIATMTRQGSGSIGLGFAIPAKTAVRVAKELIADGVADHPSIGVVVGATTDAGPGARVESVVPGSPAATADLRAGDVITAVDDVAASDPLALIALIRNGTPGETVQLTVVRDGQELKVAVSSRPDSSAPGAKPAPEPSKPGKPDAQPSAAPDAPAPSGAPGSQPGQQR